MSASARSAAPARPLLPRRARQALLSLHVVAAAGWLGATVSGLALALTAGATSDPALRVGAFHALSSLGPAVLQPLAVASLVTGALTAATSRWGLTRHVWIVVKAATATAATVSLLAYASGAVGETLRGLMAAPGSNPAAMGHVALAWGGITAVLVLDVVLSVVKPWGRMPSRGKASS